MDQTQIKKARMLGGKLGKRVSSSFYFLILLLIRSDSSIHYVQVLSLLPENETTMGSISRLLSLDDLIKGVGEESGKWVFNACRGICNEEVKSTLKVLPKSITAFKSFSGVGYPELEKWTELLATDIMKRVELDSGRNNRTPKSCTLGYTIEYGKYIICEWRMQCCSRRLNNRLHLSKNFCRWPMDRKVGPSPISN